MMALEDAGGSMCETRLPRWSIAKPGSISPTPFGVLTPFHWKDGHRSPDRGTSVPLSRNAWTLFPYTAASLADQIKSVPSRHMRSGMTASFRATATLAFLKPMRFHSL